MQNIELLRLFLFQKSFITTFTQHNYISSLYHIIYKYKPTRILFANSTIWLVNVLTHLLRDGFWVVSGRFKLKQNVFSKSFCDVSEEEGEKLNNDTFLEQK